MQAQDKESLKTYYITKYALTKGILEVEGVVEEKGYMSPPLYAKGHYGYFYKPDYHETLEEAIKQACTMRIEKVKSLEKQIEKLQTKDLTKVKKPNW